MASDFKGDKAPRQSEFKVDASLCRNIALEMPVKPRSIAISIRAFACSWATSPDFRPLLRPLRIRSLPKAHSILTLKCLEQRPDVRPIRRKVTCPDRTNAGVDGSYSASVPTRAALW